MSFVSYGFLVFMAVCLLCFLAVNAVPGNKKSRRAAVLFAASAVFLWLSGGILSLAVYGCSALTVWAGARGIERAGQQKGDSPKASAGKKRIFLAVLLCNLALLAAFKYVNFPGYTLRELAWLTGREEMVSWTPVSIPAPAAISFYTLTLLGYLIEVYWGVERAEKRFWKVALFGGFFPQMSTGPVARWGSLSATLFDGEARKPGEVLEAASEKEPGTSTAADVFFGLRRILWGLFKKLVISERLAVVVNTVYGDYETYTGSLLVLAAVCFAFQLYTDFGGAVDIALGAARMFGVRLEENFRQPFASRSIAEFWRRWHMTLGAWFKDFVMYPLMRTRAFEGLSRTCKKRFGKKAGKRVTTAAALFVVWFLLGLWHGGMWTFIIGSGLYHAFLMSAALLAEPVWSNFYKKTGIHRENPLWAAWQRVRTFVLVAIGFVFFRSDSLGMAFGIFKGMTSGDMGVFTAAGFASLGLSMADWGVLAVSMGILWAVSEVSSRREKRGDLGMAADTAVSASPETAGEIQTVCGGRGEVCWGRLSAVCAVLAFAVLILGFYGRGYDAAAFIYAAF